MKNIKKAPIWGERLRLTREKKNVTQAELADVINVSADSIRRWETGERMPTVVTLNALAFALNVSKAYLLGETEIPDPPAKYDTVPIALNDRPLVRSKNDADIQADRHSLVKPLTGKTDDPTVGGTVRNSRTVEDVGDSISVTAGGNVTSNVMGTGDITMSKAEHGIVFEHGEGKGKVRLDFAKDTPKDIVIDMVMRVTEKEMFRADSVDEALGTSLLNILGPSSRTLGQKIDRLFSNVEITNIKHIWNKVIGFFKKDSINEPRTTPIAFGIRFLESAASEDREELQELWAKLLANAMNPNFNENLIRSAYIDIIKGLEPYDVAMLKTFHEFLVSNNLWDDDDHSNYSLEFSHEKFMSDFRVDELTLKACLINLERCGLITTIHQNNSVSIGKGLGVTIGEPVLTQFGTLFIRACIE